MLFSNKEDVDEKIIRYLLEKPATVKVLKGLFARDSINITIQGIYKSLRSLVEKEVIIKRSSMYSISEDWRTVSLNKLNKSSNLFELSEGESISFELKSLVHLDQQWKNVVLPLQEDSPGEPSFLYNPHEIWLHLSESRKESEKMYYDGFIKNKSYAFHSIGGDTIHDKMIKKELQSEYMQMVVGVAFFPNTDYLIVFSDYMVKTKVSKTLANEIEKCYLESSDTAKLENKLQKIGIEKKKIKLIIERNKNKAKLLRKKMSREFYIPQELIKKYDLF